MREPDIQLDPSQGQPTLNVFIGDGHSGRYLIQIFAPGASQPLETVANALQGSSPAADQDYAIVTPVTGLNNLFLAWAIGVTPLTADPDYRVVLTITQGGNIVPNGQITYPDGRSTDPDRIGTGVEVDGFASFVF